MALTKCTECCKDVSTKATTCPSCGAPVVIPKTQATKALSGCLWIIIVLSLALIVLLAIVGKSSSDQKLSSSAIERPAAVPKRPDDLAPAATKATDNSSLKSPKGREIELPPAERLRNITSEVFGKDANLVYREDIGLDEKPVKGGGSYVEITIPSRDTVSNRKLFIYDMLAFCKDAYTIRELNITSVTVTLNGMLVNLEGKTRNVVYADARIDSQLGHRVEWKNMNYELFKALLIRDKSLFFHRAFDREGAQEDPTGR
jgi:hypothetical protein